MLSTQHARHSNIEDVLCSKTSLKMLKILMQTDLLTVTELARKTSVNYTSAKTHLETLEKADILARVMFGKRIRYYKFKDSATAIAVKNLIQVYADP